CYTSTGPEAPPRRSVPQSTGLLAGTLARGPFQPNPVGSQGSPWFIARRIAHDVLASRGAARRAAPAAPHLRSAPAARRPPLAGEHVFRSLCARYFQAEGASAPRGLRGSALHPAARQAARASSRR